METLKKIFQGLLSAFRFHFFGDARVTRIVEVDNVEPTANPSRLIEPGPEENFQKAGPDQACSSSDSFHRKAVTQEELEEELTLNTASSFPPVLPGVCRRFSMPGLMPVDGTFVVGPSDPAEQGGVPPFEIVVCDFAAEKKDKDEDFSDDTDNDGGGATDNDDGSRQRGPRRGGRRGGVDRNKNKKRGGTTKPPFYFDGKLHEFVVSGFLEKTNMTRFPFSNPSSAVTTVDGSILAIKDNHGVHFFDAVTKKFRKSSSRRRSLFGLDRFGDRELVSVNAEMKELTFCDPYRGKFCGEVSLGAIFEVLGSSASKLRFIAVDNVSDELRIAVVDWAAHCVFVVTASGVLIAVVGTPGKEGYGPGEFKNPGGVAFLRDGRLMVVDARNDRIQIFSPGYEFLQFIPIKTLGLKNLGGLTVQEVGSRQLALLFHFNPPGCVVMHIPDPA